MSTASPDTGAQGGIAGSAGAVSGAPAGPGGSASAAGSGSPVEALAVQTAAFVGAFERWAGRKAVEAGASVPRLKLLNAVHCHGPQKMADLAGELTVTPRNVTALVDGLEAEGLVRRIPHSTDRRITLVELTCSPERVAAQFGAYQASITGLFATLTPEDQRTFLRLVTTLRERMHAEAGCPSGGEASDA